MRINLSEKQKKALLNNWGDKADALACNAIVRLYDSLSKWEFYIYAMNPEDENQVSLILKNSFGSRLNEQWTIDELEGMYNDHGEGLNVDESYRPRSVESLLKRT